MSASDESAVLVLEGLLSTGTSGGLADSAWPAISAAVAGLDGGALVASLDAVRDGRAPAETLLELLKRHRLQLIAGLEPPRLRRGHGSGEREAFLATLNALAGAKEPARPEGGRLMERLATTPPHLVDDLVEGCSELPLLWALVRTGRIAERRAAVRRLGAILVENGSANGAPPDRDIAAGLAEVRDPRIAFEVDGALAALPGSPGRGARHRLARADRLLAKVEDAAGRYWSGDEDVDPLLVLVREEMLRVGVWLRRGSDALAAHVGEHLRMLLGKRDQGTLADAVGALVASGDERLVPTFGRILPDGPLPARIATARALARVADPRVHAALAKAFRHSDDDMERVVIAGALGQHGDRSALPFLLERLEAGETAMREEVIRSLADLGAREAAPQLLPLLDSDRPAIVRAAASALVRCGGAAALERLKAKAREKDVLGPHLADAADALYLRLRAADGLPLEEEPRRLFASHRAEPSTTESPEDRGPPDLGARLTAILLFLWGLVAAAVFQRERAHAAFAAAAWRSPGWPAPLLREAQLHAAHGHDDLALEAYRRAMLSSRERVLGSARWVQRLGEACLRRADRLVEERRRGEALALLDELSGLDLRKADLDLRLAVTRRRDQLLATRPRKRATTR